MSNFRLGIISSIYNGIPKEAQITRIEFEGPEIAVYVKNPSALTDKMDIIKKIVKEIKKRIVIKADSSVRKDKRETTEIIKTFVPQEAQISDIKFDDELGEVLIKAKKTRSSYRQKRFNTAENIYRNLLEAYYNKGTTNQI